LQRFASQIFALKNYAEAGMNRRSIAVSLKNFSEIFQYKSAEASGERGNLLYLPHFCKKMGYAEYHQSFTNAKNMYIIKYLLRFETYIKRVLALMRTLSQKGDPLLWAALK
jgi:hypothetical protein